MKLLTGLRLPVQQRVFVPDDHGTEDYNARAHLVSEVHLEEAGKDTVVSVRVRGESYVSVRGRVLAPDAEALTARLLRDVPKVDREMFQQLMDDLQEATAAVDTDRITLARRRLAAVMEAMAADLAIASGGAA